MSAEKATLNDNASGHHEPAWGTTSTMTDVEALMWRAEVDPRMRSDGVFLDLLDTTPDWARMVEAHEWGTRLAPRLRQRVVEDVLHLGPPMWVATELDMGYHLSRVRLAEGDGLEAVLELAAILHMSPFDPARPLWQGVLVEGLPDGKAAYMLKFHHSMADGQGAMQLFDMLHSKTREPNPDKQAPPEVPADHTNAAGLTVKRAGGMVAGSLGAFGGWARGLATTAVRTAVRPQSAVDYVQSLARVTKPHGSPSPLMRERGLARRLRVLEVPLADLRAAGKAAGGTLNDAYLAALLGGLHRYHRHHGAEVKEVPMALPVSLRQTDHNLGGNRFAGAYIAGPDEADPAARIREIHERVLDAREEPALDFLGSTAALTSRLPNTALAALSLKMAASIDLQASNIPGLGRDAYMAGAKIEKMFVFGPVPGSAIMATLLSHDGTCCIGVAMDKAAVPDPDVLLGCFRESFDEVLALREQA